MDLKAILTGKPTVDPAVAKEVAVIEKVKSAIAAAESEAIRVGAEMEAAYYNQIESPSPENEKRLEKLKAVYAKAQSDLGLARSTLKLATEKHGAALAAVEAKQQEKIWDQVDLNFDRMIELSTGIEKLALEFQEKYSELKKLTGETFTIIPSKDIRLFNDSPIGQPAVDGRLQLQFRKCGATWAKQYFGDPTKIPNFSDLFREARGWALKQRPKKGGGH